MSTPSDSQRMEKIVSLCKRRGFIFQSSEIYGGLNGAWDYGPLGVELKRNLKNYWWRVMVHGRDDVVGMDGAILRILRFSGPLATLKVSPIRWLIAAPARLDLRRRSAGSGEKRRRVNATNCGGKDLTEARQFNLHVRDACRRQVPMKARDRISAA